MIKPEITDLFNKAEALKENQVLYTTFGPDRYYVILKNDKEFTLTEYRSKWSFEKDGAVKSEVTFKNEHELNLAIFSHSGLEWYARNVFTTELKHLDNWIHFVNGFKLSKKVFYDNGDVTKDIYYYEQINLEKSKV